MKFHTLLFTLASLLLFGCHAGRQVTGANQASSGGPDHVILHLTEQPATSVGIAWRTSPPADRGLVEVAEATPGPDFPETARRVEAVGELLTSTGKDARYFNAVVNGLKPGGTYVYRVGNGSDWSEWFQFRTPEGGDAPFSFIYFGDSQNDVKSMWSRVIREAYAQLPRAGFMLHAGDLVNRYASDEDWHEWFMAGSFIHAMVPAVMTPGNHEHRAAELSPQWRPQFTLPENGPEGFEETCYFVDYNNLRLISINSMRFIRDGHSATVQTEWLRQVLEGNDKDWTVVTLHHPLFATKPGRDHDALRSMLQPLFDQYGVDLVLQGHDHAYGRGDNVPTGVTGEAGGARTMYVVSVSGPKMYDLADEEWMDRKAKNTQLFQLIRVDGKVLRYEAYTADGVLYDAFEIDKTGNDKKIINHIPDTPERLD